MFKAKTNAEIQAEFRERRAKEGLTEVRGVYAPPALHRTIKRAARRLAAERCGSFYATQSAADAFDAPIARAKPLTHNE